MAKIIGTAIASIDDLNYFEGNAKKHDIFKIRQSIMLFGFFQTLLVDKRTGSVLGGNGRLEALRLMRNNPEEVDDIRASLVKKYNLPEVEINYPPAGITVKNDQWHVNVLEIETVSDAEAIAINLQDNFSVLDGGDFTLLDKSRAFEVDALLEQLEALKEADFLPVSVDNDDLDLLLRELEERNNGDDSDWDDEPESSRGSEDEKGIDCECPKCNFRFTKIVK